MKKCPNCAKEIDDDDLFCPECGLKLSEEVSDFQNKVLKCPECGTIVFDDDKFCPFCGADLSNRETETVIENVATTISEEMAVDSTGESTISEKDKKILIWVIVSILAIFLVGTLITSNTSLINGNNTCAIYQDDDVLYFECSSDKYSDLYIQLSNDEEYYILSDYQKVANGTYKFFINDTLVGNYEIVAHGYSSSNKDKELYSTNAYLEYYQIYFLDEDTNNINPYNTTGFSLIRKDGHTYCAGNTTYEIDDAYLLGNYLVLNEGICLRVRNGYSTNATIIGYIYEHVAIGYYDSYYDGTYVWYRINDSENWWIADDGMSMCFY